MWEFGAVKCQISRPSVTVRRPTWSMFHLHCTVEVKEELPIWEGQLEADERRQTEKNGRQKLSRERWLAGWVGGACKSRHLTGRRAPLTGTDTLHYPCRNVCAHIFIVRVRVSV